MRAETGYTGLVGEIGASLRVVVIACVVFGLAGTAYAQSSATVGSVRGIVRDKSTKEAAAGATVVATSPSLVGDQTAIADETGQYFITSLPPGIYTLTIFYGATFTRGGVLVRVGKESVVNIDVTSAAPKGEVITIQGTVPLVDQGSTKTGITITDDYTRNLPTGRTFGEVLGAAAGSLQDAVGPSFNGTTSPENVFIIEGLDTTDTGFGGLSTNLPNEFIAETEVVTGGYSAEFGRSTGGLVNVVTKQGSNRFAGSVFGYFKSASLVADAKPIQHDAGSIDQRTALDYEYDFGGEVGGPIIKDRLWFHVGLNPTFARTNRTRFVRSRRDDDADGRPDIDESTGFELRDEVARMDVGSSLATMFFTAKINGAVDQNHQFQVTAFGSPAWGNPYTTVNRNPAMLTIDQTSGSIDGAAKWTSKLFAGRTQLDAVVGYHRTMDAVTPRSPVGALGTVRFNYPQPRSLYDFVSLENGNLNPCQDGGPDDRYPMIVNCPVNNYQTQGSGQVWDEVRDRTQVVVSGTQRVRAAGYHTFKAGLDFMFAGYGQTVKLTGGRIAVRRQPDDLAGRPGPWTIFEQYEYQRELGLGEDPVLADDERLCAGGRSVCRRVDTLVTTTSNTTYAAYVQDQWSPLPNLTINAGLRWERQIGSVADEIVGRVAAGGERIPRTAYELDNLIAPRVGAIFDPTREGKAKLFAHWGRYYENVPMDLNVRAFGNGIGLQSLVNRSRLTPASGQYDPNCDVDITSQPAGTDLASVIAQCRDRVVQFMFGDGLAVVTDGLRGQYTDELVTRVEYELIADLKVGVSYVRRTLPRVIEDVSIDSGNTYVITNPGEDFSSQADALRERAAGVEDEDLKQILLHRADTFDNIAKLDKPVRDYDAIQLTVMQRPTRRSLLQASYTYSRLRGNYSGALATDTGQLDPNISAVYDLPELMANRFGAMKLDRPHNIKIDGFYVFPLGKRDQLVAGASFRAQSGVSHMPLGAHPIYGCCESILLPRGTFGRSPMTSQSDLHISYGHRVTRTMLLEGFFRVFNVFDQQAELDSDDVYTLEPAMPIVGGDTEDLRHLKAQDIATLRELDRTVRPYRNFHHTSDRQEPRTLQIGARLTF